jgi:hypothetical protein
VMLFIHTYGSILLVEGLHASFFFPWAEREKIISTAGNVKHLMVSMFKHSSSLLIQQ